jgi:hypothetical protein
MARITITIESDIGELGSILSRLGGLREMESDTQNSLANQEWTRERVLAVWADLSEGMKEVLGVIARNDNKSWEEQLQIIGRSGQEVGGSLSSLSAQLRNHSLGGITYPLLDNEADGHKLLPIWQEIVLEKTS